MHDAIIASATMHARVFDQFVDWVSGSNWSYVAIFTVSMLDAFADRAERDCGDHRRRRRQRRPVAAAA